MSELAILGGAKTRTAPYPAWPVEAIFRAGPQGVDDTLHAIQKIRANVGELAEAACQWQGVR